MRKRILNQPIDIISMDDASHIVKMAIKSSRHFKIITLNPEMVVNATKNIEFQSAINNSQLIVPDGIGIVLASKILGTENVIERIPGIELAESMLETVNELSKKIAIFGGKKEILDKAVSILNNKYPKIQFVKTLDGYQEDQNKVAKEIASSNPDLVLVALGSPKQELWINNHANIFPRSVMIGVGGSLDVWSGKKQRAPKWIRNIYLEWFFRLLIEPQRIPRVIKTLPKFTWMVFKEKFKL